MVLFVTYVYPFDISLWLWEINELIGVCSWWLRKMWVTEV